MVAENEAWWIAERVGCAMAMPDAAMAPARPVGLRAVDFLHGRFLSFVVPFWLVEARDAASESRDGCKEEVPFVESTLGRSALIAVGDSTRGLCMTASDSAMVRDLAEGERRTRV